MKNILVIAGASGVGKTSIASRLRENSGRFSMVRSMTTRAPRGDGHDSEYIYTDRETFLKKAGSGEFVEYMEYGDNLYATPKSELDRIFGEGKIPLLILDIEGVKSLRSGKYDFTPVIFYIWADLNVIEKRLYERDLAEPTADKLLSFLKRKEANIKDYLGMPEISCLFDAFVENVGIEETASIAERLFYDFSKEQDSFGDKNKEISEKLMEMAKLKQ